MGVNYKGSQGQTERAVALKEEEEEEVLLTLKQLCLYLSFIAWFLKAMLLE